MTSVGPATAPARGARGVEVYTRVSLYVVVLAEPFLYLYWLAIGPAGDTEAPGGGAVLALVVAAALHTLACFGVVHVGFTRPLVRGGRPGPLVWALAGTSVAVPVVAVLALPSSAMGGGGMAPATAMTIVCGAATAGALAVVLRARRIAGAGLVVALVAAGVQALVAGSGLILVALLAYLAATVWTSSVRLSMWIVEVVRRLEEAQAVSARLAVAEERLRIARDMHDVVGRALSAVAVKSELAAALARRGDPQGAAEMDDVRTLAQDSLREVRGVVAGYRAADLATELDGARSVLRAAGVTVRVVGEVPTLGPPQVEALAWAVREGATNIVRHSAARECRIDLAADEEQELVLRMSNDGVRADPRSDGPAGAAAGGNGLVGLRERLVAVGGSLVTSVDADRFVLEARVPAPSEVTA
ncbi:sensor histidine kinase [Promicromonospora sp. Marseille-Q5078]